MTHELSWSWRSWFPYLHLNETTANEDNLPEKKVKQIEQHKKDYL